MGLRRAIFGRLRIWPVNRSAPKTQGSCHSARWSVWRRERLVWELADEVRPDTNGLKAGALENGAHGMGGAIAADEALSGV